MDKKEILDILDNAKDERGAVPMRLVRQAFDKLPTIQPVATDTNVGDMISRKGVFIPNITVEMFRNASLEGVEDLMVSGEMEDISLPSAQPERKKGKWIGQKGGGYCCSECGRYALDEVDGNFIHVAFKSNFCPYCGADMRGEQG